MTAPAHPYLHALLEEAAGSTQRLSPMADASEAVAGRLAAGGRLFLASARPDFVSEGFVRSGGLMLLQEWGVGAHPSPQDAVIVGWSGTTAAADRELLSSVRAAGPLVVGIGPSGGPAPPDVDVWLPVAAPPATALEPFGGQAYPLTSLQCLLTLWAFTGEIVAALTRQGRMPALYQSVLVPGARERNSLHAGAPLHESHSVPAIPPGRLGNDYLESIGAILQALIEEEVATIAEVGRVCAEVLAAGHTIHAGMISHFPMHQCGAPGDPGYMERLSPLSGETPSVPEIEAKLRRGDLLFFLGYYRRPTEAYAAARRAGARIVEIITGDGSQMREQPDYVIRPHWPFGDALVRVPGYDVEILPGSGIVQAAIYWAVVASIWQARSESWP